MPSVLDQIDWSRETDAKLLLQLVSTQIDSQDETRKQIRAQLEKDYPASALAWLPTVTWSAPTLVPLASFDLHDIKDWPTWKDKEKTAKFVERIKNGWHKPIVTVKIPGGRYLIPIDGHTRIGAYYTLKLPVLAWIGKTHAVHGPWEAFHEKQSGMTVSQKALSFAAPTVAQQLAMATELSAGRTSTRLINDLQYRMLLEVRRQARTEHTPGHPDRVSAERAVRVARKSRPDPVAAFANQQAERYDSGTHSDLLAKRREAQAEYPAGHPERVLAERNVRKSRSLARKK